MPLSRSAVFGADNWLLLADDDKGKAKNGEAGSAKSDMPCTGRIRDDRNLSAELSLDASKEAYLGWS